MVEGCEAARQHHHAPLSEAQLRDQSAKDWFTNGSRERLGRAREPEDHDALCEDFWQTEAVEPRLDSGEPL